MYEELTAFLPKMQSSSFGEWIIDRENDGSPEHPKRFPFVLYDRVVDNLIDAVYHFEDQHHEMGLNHYYQILEVVGLKWDYDSMKNADVSVLDGRTIMALLLGAIRADRFCEGALLDFCEDGSITKWLLRLKEIDEGI